MHFKGISLLLIIIIAAGGFVVSAQQDMQKMSGMKMSNTRTQKKKTTRRKPKAKRKRNAKSGKHKQTRPKQTARTKQATTKHSVGNMPGMNMSGMNLPKSQASPASQPSQQMNMPGMKMQQPSPSPTASPDKTQMNMPGMQMPNTSPTPQASPQQKMEMSMPMPAASPGASPQKMDMNMPMPSASPSTSPLGQMAGMENMQGVGSMNMGPLMVMMDNDMGIRVGSSDSNVMSMGAMGSGTSWEPSSGPMHMHYWNKNNWLLMFHYNLIAGVNHQGGPRGVTKFDSENWFMLMAYHKLGKGTLQLRGMFSAEPFTFPPGGSPLLFQTGETYKGRPLIDHQHPHDLFMELSAQYTVPVGERGTWFTYFGYPGEPALGPVAFMHRMSASENPSATLAHHLQDSTHISFGVFTTGLTYRWFKLEGSIFNGREPDENRYDFDAHKWNSRSARLWFMPNKNWTFQISHGFLRSPEAQEPDADIRRSTASVQYNRPFNRGNWATAFVWGRNHVREHGEIINLNSYTAESTVNFLDKNYVYTRLELVDKDDLLTPADKLRLGITQDHPSFRIGAYTFGGVRDVWTSDKFQFGIGSDLTFYSKPATLDLIYGNNPVSWKLFFRIRPAKMDMNMHGMHGNMNTTTGAPMKH
ncbi:MAG: hypothetical protein C5B55_14540 [Blastocatellia bacterium]|nr:MAG: hypothetical protein C5B55_14540 [Blastocatellia bacterium]